MAVTIKPHQSYNRQKITIPGQSLYTVDFGEMQPNFYRLNNMDDVTLYCSTNNIPSQKFYDFKANPFSVANYAEPKISSKLYIYNPVNKDVDAIIFYWSDEFDPTFMAVGEISLNNEGVVETDGIVKGFTTSLPSGNNTIGKVEITNTSKEPVPVIGSMNLTNSLPMGSNVIGKVGIDGNVNLATVTNNNITSIKTGVTNLKTNSDNILLCVEKLVTSCCVTPSDRKIYAIDIGGNLVSETFTLSETMVAEGYYIKKIHGSTSTGGEGEEGIFTYVDTLNPETDKTQGTAVHYSMWNNLNLKETSLQFLSDNTPNGTMLLIEVWKD